MTRSTGIARALVCLMIAALLPLCCCSVRGWVGVPETNLAWESSACCDCVDEAAQPGDGGQDAARLGVDEGAVCVGESCAGSALRCSHHPADGDHCKCGKHDTKMLTRASFAIEFPMPLLVATLNWVGAIDPNGCTSTLRGCPEGPVQPCNALLRLHCALVI